MSHPVHLAESKHTQPTGAVAIGIWSVNHPPTWAVTIDIWSDNNSASMTVLQRQWQGAASVDWSVAQDNHMSIRDQSFSKLPHWHGTQCQCRHSTAIKHKYTNGYDWLYEAPTG